ncbi:MAG: hypothetical protein LBI38_07440 [Oscillospiraceae bacterium]|jgi:hypothetical protein|nr:hypothetical protein [Oscillospiraceae bacterium]
MSGPFGRLRARLRERSDKAASGILAPRENLLWSGRPGYVATFNVREAAAAVPVIAIVAAVSVIVLGVDEFPAEFTAIAAASVSAIAMLFAAWVRQVIRYIKTINLYYAVTDERVVIARISGSKVKIAAQQPLYGVKSAAVSRRFFGNGSFVFNMGEDYFEKGGVLESPERGVLAFFNIADVDGAAKALKRAGVAFSYEDGGD